MDRRLLTLAAGTFAVGTDAFVMAGLLPRIAASLAVPIASAGQLVTAYALAYGLLSPALAAVTGRWPRKRVLQCGLALFVAGNVATALLPTYLPILARRVVAGAGGAMYTPAALAFAAARPPASRARALAVVMAGLSVATGVATDRFGTRPILRAAIGVSAVNFALLPWTGDRPATALVTVAVWGFCGWAVVVPNLHRLVATGPATLLTALNSAVIHLGAAASGGIGAAALVASGPRGLGPVGAALVAAGLILAEPAAKEKKHDPVRAAVELH